VGRSDYGLNQQATAPGRQNSTTKNLESRTCPTANNPQRNSEIPTVPKQNFKRREWTFLVIQQAIKDYISK
jgi:hypothetical protein